MPRDKFETAIRLVGQAYSCFEPTDANRFLRAAKLLVNEMEGCNLNMIQEFTSEHPQFFKYLHTIGVSTHQGLKVPDCDRWDVVMLTMPHSPRKTWSPKFWDYDELMKAANKADEFTVKARLNTTRVDCPIIMSRATGSCLKKII